MLAQYSFQLLNDSVSKPEKGTKLSLTIYGHPASQPSRTVYWACLIKDLPFELGTLDQGNGNPRGQVPWIDDDGFVLSEMSAIVCYLADKHRWHDLYPESLQVRARLQQFLHMHHSLVRMATVYLMAPHVIKPLSLGDRPENPFSFSSNKMFAEALAHENPYENGGRVVTTIAGFLEQHYFDDDSPYLCNTAEVNLADLACYGELGQFEFANLFDFSPFPRMCRWLEAMHRTSHFDTIHAYNKNLGDIRHRPNTNERFLAASEAGFQAIRQAHHQELSKA